MVADKRLNDCLRRVTEVESKVNESLADIKKDLTELCKEDEGESDVNHNNSVSLSSKEARKKAVKSLNSADKSKCKEVFDSADKDRSGKVSVIELKSLLEEVHDRVITHKEFESMMREFDKDRDGQMDLDEFLVCFAYTDEQKRAYFEQQMLHELHADVHHAEAREREQKVRIEGVAMADVTRYLRKELDETEACLQLPQAMCIFILFACSVTIHFKFDILHGVDKAITWDVEQNANFAFSGIVPFENGRMGHKGIYDVNSIPDFWSWFTMGLCPLFWPQGWDVNEVRSNTGMMCTGAKDALDGYGSWKPSFLNKTINTPILASCPEQDGVTWPSSAEKFIGIQPGEGTVQGKYLLFHDIVAGVRLRQERVDAVDCSVKDEDVEQAVHRGKCVPSALDYWLIPELTQAFKMSTTYTNTDEGKDQLLLNRWDQSKVREKLRDLENAMWFSPSTAKVEITFVTYNAHQDLVTSTYVFFFLNTGGHIHKIVEPVSFFLHPYDQAIDYIFDIFWAILILKLFIEESIELVKHWCQLGFLKGTTEYMNFINFIDWIGIIYAFVLVGLWSVQLVRLSDLTTIMKTGNALVPGTFADDATRYQFFAKVDDIVKETHLFRTLLSVYPFIIVSRFFKAFSSQPRLAMVTNTLSQASIDIFHFGVVFASVFTVFTLSALLLWGQELEYFANFPRAFNTVFRIMLGDFDWDELHEVGRPQAYLWFWTFQWLVNLIMLNMLLAIIMDVYSEVKAGIGHAETLWSQTYEIIHREKEVWAGHALRLKEVLKSLDPTDLVEEDDDEHEHLPVRVETLVSEHDVPENQALHILIEAQKLHETQMAAEEHNDDVKRVRRIDQRVMQMHRFLERYMHSNVYGGSGGATPSVTI